MSDRVVAVKEAIGAFVARHYQTISSRVSDWLQLPSHRQCALTPREAAGHS